MGESSIGLRLNRLRIRRSSPERQAAPQFEIAGSKSSGLPIPWNEDELPTNQTNQGRAFLAHRRGDRDSPFREVCRAAPLG
jgi:hypothetical protein